MTNHTTVEQKTASTILQAPVEVVLGGKTYKVAPPSIATLILASEIVSQLPQIKLNPEKVIEESLAVAKDFSLLGDIAAVFILGARKANEKVKRTIIQRILRRPQETALISLSRELLHNATPRELHAAIAQILMKMQLGDFFGLTTFLTEINLLRPTKVETEATASGQ